MGDDRERDGGSGSTALIVAVIVILILAVLGFCVCGGLMFGFGGLLLRPVNVAPPMQAKPQPAPIAPVAPPGPVSPTPSPTEP